MKKIISLIVMGIFAFTNTNAQAFLWAKQVGSDTFGVYTEEYQVHIDKDGNTYILGIFDGSGVIDADPGPGVYILPSQIGIDKTFLIKLDASGNFVWAKIIPVFADLPIKCTMTTDISGNIYLGGQFYNMVNIDPGPSVYPIVSVWGGASIFISKLDTIGNFAWAQKLSGGMGNLNGYAGYSVALDTMGAMYVAGKFIDTIDFDPGLSVFELTTPDIWTQHGFILKYHYCGANYPVTYNGCDSITLFGYTYYSSGTYVKQFMNAQKCDSNIVMTINIGTNGIGALTDSACAKYHYYGQPYTTSGVYTQTIPTVNGCDSVITLTLNTHSINTGVTQSGALLTANASGAGITYQWIQCNPFQVIGGATGQSYTPTVNGEYAIIIYDGDKCSDTSACYAVYGLGLADNTAERGLMQIYPNPTKGTFSVLHVPKGSTKEFYNSLGELLFSTNLEEIDVRQYSKGVYYIRCSGQVRKVVVD